MPSKTKAHVTFSPPSPSLSCSCSPAPPPSPLMVCFILSPLFPPPRLTAGPDNLLLHYVLLENGRGVLLTPFSGQVSPQPVHQRLLSSFRHAAADLHMVLQQKWHEEEEEEDVAEGDSDCAKDSNHRPSQVRSAAMASGQVQYG